MLKMAVSHNVRDRNEHSTDSAAPERPLGRPSMPSLRARTSPLKFLASSSTTKPKEVHDSHHEWEKEYLKDLRLNRPPRPSGTRPPPGRVLDPVEPCNGTALRTSSAMSFRPPLALRQTSPSRIPEPERCSTAISQPRERPDTSTSVSIAAEQIPPSDKPDASATKGRPLVQILTEVTRLSDSSSATRISSGVYKERGHRLIEKEEARMLREALEMVDLEEEARLHSAAQDEASDLVWTHQNPGASREDLAAPYLYKQRMCTNPGRSQSDGPVVTKANREFDHPAIKRPISEDANLERREENTERISDIPASDGQKNGPECVQKRESCHQTTTSKPTNQQVDHVGKSQSKSTDDHAFWDSPQKRAYMNLSFSLPQVRLSGRRRSSGSKMRTPSGSLFRNPDDKIYEEPEEIKQEATESKSLTSADSVPLRSMTRNPVTKVRAASPPCIRTVIDPAESKGKYSRTEIHRNPPSQSRDPSYVQNKRFPASLEQSKDGSPELAKGDSTDAVEIRGDDIRAATSMRLRDRSPKLPSPTVVSNAKGRPIVSFEKDWIPSKTDLKLRGSSPQRPAHHETCLAPSPTRSKPPLPESTASAPAIPTINFPESPSIQIDEVPSMPSIHIPSVPSISLSMDETSSTPTGQRAKSSRPLPTPSGKSVPRVSGRPLPHHSSTAPVHNSISHWSPAQHRATAQCAGCALSISGRVVRASSQRFHPECFTCFHCSEQLECVAFYPEPDSFRNERIARIRARAEGTTVRDEAGKSWEDDGDESLRFYCHLDFHERFSPRCRSCRTPIEGEVVVACGGEWHAGHFFCAQCGDPFDQRTPFVEKDGVGEDVLKATDAAAGPLIFKPRLLLPRSSLPLAYLNTFDSNGVAEYSKLFFAHVAALESPSFQGTPYLCPRLLITERNGNSLYTIERIRPGLYIQCKLGSWVTLSQLQELRDADGCLERPSKRIGLEDAAQWWREISSQGKGCAQLRIGQRTVGASWRQNLGLGKPKYISPNLTLFSHKVLAAPPPVEAVDAAITASEDVLGPQPQPFALNHSSQASEDLFKTIGRQYMDSLYKSKASLAYFAKGPLSRARAAFSDCNDAPLGPRHLVDYLRTLIIPLNLLDKKYRETLPTLVAEIPMLDVSEYEGIEAHARAQRSIRKSKKGKIGKNGLYAEEEKDIRKWWLDQRVLAPTCESEELRTDSMKTTLLEQKTREICLQIILVLEVLALEGTLPVPSIESAQGGDDEEHLSQRKRRLKKQPDLSVLLDLSIDKLCIWQTMTVEHNKSSGNPVHTGPIHGESLPAAKPDTDHLRDFCVDVILPFYAARLPELSRALCKKLGGPLPHSPDRPALRKAPPPMKPPKPGAAVERPQSRQVRRTLERVLTDENTTRRLAPALSRSATDSVLPDLKREPSDTPLSNVPSKRPTFHKANRYSQREVDLGAVSQAAEAKAKRKANVEQELQGAIAALKRPNPRMAVKEFVEAAEKRAARARSRKSKHPVRNPFAQGVQIMATPSANRRRDVFARPQSRPLPSSVMQQGVEEEAPSSFTHVPASTVKPRDDAVARGATSNARQPFMSTVEQTPTRGPSKFAHLGHVTAREGIIQRTPSSTMKVDGIMSIQDTSQRGGYRRPAGLSRVPITPSRKAAMDSRGSLQLAHCEGTPMKCLTSVSANVRKASKDIEVSPASNEADVSIYKSLGWEDDDVDELLNTSVNVSAAGDDGTPAKEKDGVNIEDLSLPRSMVQRLAKGVLPPNTQIQKDAITAMSKGATVFVSYIAD
ncbi:MAG: hypothetical protein Q9173_003046, partial [Seirophora scorigena]